MMKTSPTTLAGYAIILSALLALVVQYLFLQTHGPYEAALERVVWGLDHHDYSRWAIIPALLALPGLLAFHQLQRDKYGKTGQWGFRLVFYGWILAAAGQIWDYMLFDPWVHPMHGIGFLAQVVAILLLFPGFILWGWALIRGRLHRAIPIFWFLFLVGLFVDIFIDLDSLLYPRYGIDDGFLSDIALGISLLLIGLVLVRTEGKI